MTQIAISGIVNTVRWIEDCGFTNVVLEVANRRGPIERARMNKRNPQHNSS
jgi:hypothetical protein